MDLTKAGFSGILIADRTSPSLHGKDGIITARGLHVNPLFSF